MPGEPPENNDDDLKPTDMLETQTVSGPSTGAEQIGPYRLLEKLGEGGMGEVWLAEQQEPVKRNVALKVIKQGMDTKQVVARFEDHPDTLSSVQSAAVGAGHEQTQKVIPNLVDLYDAWNKPDKASEWRARLP